MINMIVRKYLWIYISLVLLTIAFTSHAAPPNPRLFLQQLERGISPSMSVMSALKQLSDPDIPKTGYSPQPDGIEYILAIRIDFSDQPGQKSAAEFNDAIFGESGTSMRLYYEEVSYNQMHIRPGYLGGSMPKNDGWYRASKNMSYYGNGGGTIMVDRYAEMTMEACKMADADVDFSKYDRDGDGYIDHLMIIHAGNDEASSGIPTDIWSALIDSVPGIYDGTRISSAIILAEDPSNSDINIGIYCHEFFHEFGAPDLYSWNHPVGHWCLMGYFGPYHDNGQHPSHISGYLKWDFNANPFDGVEGWIEPDELESPGTYFIDSFELQGGNRFYKVDVPGKSGREYFLLENRNRESGATYDKYIPESGLVIWHIDENIPISYSNVGRAWVEDPSDPDHSSLSHSTEGAAYSANDGQTSFTPASQPNTNTSDGEYSGIIITDIGQEGMSMPFTLFSGDTYEPNDSMADSYGLLEYGKEYSSYIRDGRDIDFYKFHAESSSSILIYLENISENLDYNLQIFDSQGALLDFTDELRQTEKILNLEIRTSGIYYIAVNSEAGYSSTQPYSLTIDSVPLAPGIIAIFKIYPNPGPKNEENILFDYKLLDLVESISLDIYTPIGDLVYSHNTSDANRTGQISWDARTESGIKVASGIYVYVLKANLNGETDVRTGKIAVVY